jgi:RHS repeat-associated protein
MPTVNYLWDEVSDSLIGEYDENGDEIVSYTSEPKQFGNVNSQHRADSGSSFYHHDGLGSTVAMTDQGGNVTDTYAYNAFGETISQTGSTVNRFGFCGALGYYADAETSDHYVRARMYRPAIARWLSVDPVALLARTYAAGNDYSYVSQRPTLYGDPSGKERWDYDPPPVGNVGTTCKIRLRCQRVYQWYIPIATHCGLDIKWGASDYSIDGTGGDVNFIDWETGFSTGHTTEWADFDVATCECLRTTTNRWNALVVDRDHENHNSNWTLRCLTEKCGITLSWTDSGVFSKPIGWDCMECVRYKPCQFPPPLNPGLPGDVACAESAPCKCPDTSSPIQKVIDWIFGAPIAER